MALALPCSLGEVPADLERNLLQRPLAPAGHDVRDPRAVGRQGPVGVGIVLESSVERARDGRGLRLGPPILGAAGRVGDRGRDLECGEEAITLGHPLRRAGLEVEEVAQEVLGRGVLVQPTDQIGDGAVEILRAHHGRVQ
jgi:hypothetical protein